VTKGRGTREDQYRPLLVGCGQPAEPHLTPI
jgi:hypothetical protein